jgi:hypothetical protein
MTEIQIRNTFKFLPESVFPSSSQDKILGTKVVKGRTTAAVFLRYEKKLNPSKNRDFNKNTVEIEQIIPEK